MKKIDPNKLTIQAKYLEELRLGVFETSEALFPYDGGIELKRESASQLAFPGSLFQLPGVEEISARGPVLKLRFSIGTQFRDIAPLVGKHIRAFLAEHTLPWEIQTPAKTSAGETLTERVKDEAERELLIKISKVLEETVAPSLSAHGGSVKALGFDHGAVILQFSGGCQGCSQVSNTVKFGIEKILLEQFPELKGVMDATEHAHGDTPYYS